MDDPEDLRVKVSIKRRRRLKEWKVPKAMAEPTSGILWNIVLIILAPWLWRGALGFLQILEQRVDHVVDVLVGETFFVTRAERETLAERDTHIRRAVVVVVVAMQGCVGNVGGVDRRERIGRFVKTGGRCAESWFGDEAAVPLRRFTVRCP